MLSAALHEVVQHYPEHITLRHDGRSLSYAELWELSGQRALQLRRRGVSPGDRVAILADNGIDAVVCVWAIYRVHAISVYLNEQLKPDGLQQIIDDAKPALVLCLPGGLRAKLLPEPGCPVLDLDDLADGPDVALAELGPANADQIASIIYTSGSTGKPKGVCLTHGNLVSVARMAADGYSTHAEDSYLMVVPLHYIHGLMIQLCMQLRGACIEFMNSFLFPAAVTRKLQSSGVQGFSGVPYHFAALIDRGGFLEADLPSLRWIGVTGGTISPERLRQIRLAKPELEIHISYGQTECSPRITLLNPERIDTKPTSVGSVADGLTVEFIDEEGNPVAPGEIGELVVAGPNVMHGYWNDPEGTARAIDAQGRLHTGDLAIMDADGDIFIKGRRQAMIKSAGERIFPEELEALINTHPAVADVAVVGVPDAIYGQRVEAHVVLKTADASEGSANDPEFEQASVKSLREHCLRQVPFARAPRDFHLWQAFPLKANGKTDKQLLMAGTVQSKAS